MSQLYDITIVGGGPVGLFAAFYAHLRCQGPNHRLSSPTRWTTLPFSILKGNFRRTGIPKPDWRRV